ncbi:hypothetical protein SLS64_006915 [Diaporthe eres]|uniref:2EXR domain-containing protein n=1 Tax=Diaporthe eres TaxID=83184 RepID=A0ABR1NN87_DIAER
MADSNSPQSNEDIPLGLLSTNLLPPQSPGLPKPSLTVTASPNGAVPQTFPRFPGLPPELRITIWELSLPHRAHTFPRPSKTFDFKYRIWRQEKVHGAKAEKRPTIAHVCSEARAVALASGSAKKISFCDGTKDSNRLSRVWVDSKRDTVVVHMGQPATQASGRPRRSPRKDHLYGLLVNRDMHIALDSSWALCFCTMIKDQGRKLYYDLVRGRKECDFIILDLILDVNDEEAASTGLFGNSGANDCVLIPIEDTRQMSRLFDAQAKFDTVDWLSKWKNFTQLHKPANVVDFMRRWKKLAAREMRHVQKGLDFLTGVEVGRQGKDAGEIEKQIARIRAIRSDQPKFRPVIMVSRGAESLPWFSFDGW